ncbi:unnamed protein product [Brachionus calyciflorus]|uniref:Uncharacterized protein n=1 Tax=Brachionus calyciflorus TaxID=104777 RepID=A0A814MXX7_9BILA|nr:unnamed protein product [Brachionus calyciflorus]
MTTPTEIKDKHYSNLESILDKNQRFNNTKTITETYISNDLVPKSLSKHFFPEPLFKDDNNYKDMFFNELIPKFQNEKLQFNLDFINSEIESLNQNISNEISNLEKIDTNVDSKIQILKEKISKRHDSHLKNGIEQN